MINIPHQETSPQIGYFLKYQHWENAFDLLEYQLSLKTANKHFNMLSMFYYEQLNQSDKKRLRRKLYFDNKIANNLFYGLEKEFAILFYPIPKSNLGLRKYSFFTYPMRVTYYAVGLYLLQLSQEIVQQHYSNNDRIHSDYGGQLVFDSKTNKLKLTDNSVWYKPHYRRFRNRVRKETSGSVQDKIVIHIDIQNYFEEISIPILLDFLTEYVRPSIRQELRFDLISKRQIAALFDFIANGKSGIPQMDNDIISSFIGYLYLIFGDMLLDEELNKDSKFIKDYFIIRYMDDIYISLDFFSKFTKVDKEIHVRALTARIADCLYYKLGLRLNAKTKIFRLYNSAEKDELLKNLKKISPGHEMADDDSKGNPNHKIDLIFNRLEKLKNSISNPAFEEWGELDEEILKEVYDTSVNQLLKRKENYEKIHKIFKGFNFDLVIAQAKEILVIMLIDPLASKQFENFLLKKKTLTSRDIYLILNYLCQTDFKSIKLIKLLRRNPIMQPIMDIYSEGKISTLPGYFHLTNRQISKLTKMTNVIEQIRLRIKCERQEEYSVALNHLLNEIHAICINLDDGSVNKKDYRATDAINFLTSLKVPHETRQKIRNLFDRRNKNPVSHADPIAWLVVRDEYLDYHNHVGICLRHIV